MRAIAFASSLIVAAGLPPASGIAQEGAWAFGLWGDSGYTEKGIGEAEKVVAQINQQDLQFVVHIGDFEADGGAWSRSPSGPMPCTPESFERNLQLFQTVKHPFVLTPGDNDWNDCSKLTGRKVDTRQLLDHIRNKFFPEGKSLGQRPMVVESQAGHPQYAKFKENLRWSKSGVLFVTLHIVGSNDNFDLDPSEATERKAANIAWMKEAFAKAKADRARGLVILTQVDPAFENYKPGRGATANAKPSAYDDYISALTEEVEQYEKQVAFLHGDTHMFRIDMPLYSRTTRRLLTNFTRIETFGNPESHWVKVTVNPSNPRLFSAEAEIVPGN